MRKLAINTGLAFVAGFVTSFGAFIAATPKAPDRAALVAAGAAALYAGARLAVGVIAQKVEALPTIPVDQ